MRILVGLIILLLFVFSAGCGSNSVDAGEPLEVPAAPLAESYSTSIPVLPAGEDIQMTASLSTPADSNPQNLIDKAIADLAQRLSIPATEIKLIESSEVVWTDASLGCPQMGIVYTQVLTSGFLIHLEAGGNVYEYHAGFNEQVILCEAPLTPIAPVKPGDIQDGQPWMPP